METQEQQQPQIVSVTNPYLLRLKCFICQAPNLNINDENNNLKKDQNTNEKSFNPISKLPLYTCPECEAKIRLEEKETASSSTVTSQEFEGESDRMIIVPDTSSDDDDDDDECCCQSCTDDEHDSNYRQLWDDLSHTIKCVYRQTDREFSETHFVDNICKAKDYVKKLTDINSPRLFTKLESIVFEYVREIRNQVLERFHTCSKTSHDVQLFISFLLDEYHIFIQAATNVSTILSYLEEQYMKSFHLTWLLYNKHLYEKLIYMNKKIQHSMSTMIDLLQPTNDDNDYSPAEYTQLLNRFLAFDEEMSEIACLYKDSQEKSKLPAFDVTIQNGYSTENKIKINKKKKKCKKVKKTKQLATSSTEANTNSSSTTAVDIPSSNTSSSVPVPPEQGSNGSSIGSGIGGDESSSSVSSVDDYLLDHETSSSGYTQEEHEDLEHLFTEEDLNELLLEGILDGVSPIARMHHEILQSRLNEKQTDPITTTIDNDKWIEGIIQGIQSVREREQKTTANDITTTVHCTTTKEGLNVPLSSESSSKKSSSIKSKSNKSSHRRKETSTQPTTTTTTSQIPRKSIAADLILPRSIADLSAKIQSVSFTAGTFGSITSTNPNECYHSSSSSSSSSNCSTTTLTAAKTTTATGQTRLSINLTRKPGSKTTEHGGQKIAEALLNELTGLGNGECLNSGRKKDNQQFKKTKQQRSTINETLLNSTNNPHSFFNSSTKCDSHSSSSSSSSASSSSAAQFNLDHLLRNAASNTDVSEAALHSILSSFHSQTSLDASSLKHPISSKASEALQTLLAQQQHHHHHHHHYQQQKRNLSNNTNKLGEFCCCEFSEGRTCSASSTCLHLSSTSNTNNGPITSCVTCMALPGTTTTTTTTSVMGATITGAFNQRNVDMKERLKLKFAKRNVQNLTEQHTLAKDQQKKTTATTAAPAATAAAASTKKPTTTTITQNSPKTKECLNNDKNDIDDLVRFIDGNETISSNHNEHQISITTTTTTNESTSKKNKKKKDKQLKIDHTEEVKSNTSQPKEQQQQQTNQKKQNGPTTSQLTTSPQPPSRSASSSSSTKAASVASSSTSIVEAQQPLSKRKLKAKLKLEQQQKQSTNDKEPSAAHSHTSATTINPTPASTVSVAMLPASYSSSQGTNTPRTSVDLPSESFDMPEEEVNWITISRKQSKHKPSPASVPSLLAAPILPVVPPTNNKQHRQQQQQQTTVHTKKAASTVNGSSLAQQKVTLPTVVPSTISSEAVSTSSKQQQTTIAPSALQNVLKNHTTYQPSKVEPQAQLQPPLNLWNINNIHDHTLVTSPAATLLPTSSSSSYISTHSVPSSSPATSVGLGSTSTIPSSSSILSEGLSSSLYWDPNGYILPSTSQSTIIPSTVPGPVQRPSTSFSPAPGPVHNTTSRCIQRPSPEPRSCSTNNIPFPLYSPMNYAASSSTSSWNDTPVTNTHESQWGYSQEQQQLRSSTTPTDFPLYDPFHSGARLTIPSTTLLPNGFSEHYTDLCIVPQDNDINEMDALDKEIEDFKKFCFENVPLETREKVQANIECCFVRQA